MNSSRFRSLRWQLPLSYAAIALLAVLALGVALLGTLRAFYREQELTYLTGNASAISEEILPLLAANEQGFLQSQIVGFAFLTQTRIQVLDEVGETILADSAELGDVMPTISVNSEGNSLLDSLGLAEDEVSILIEEEEQISDDLGQRVVTRTSKFIAQGSLFGFNLGAGETAVNDRSNLVINMPIVDQSGHVEARLLMSQGPAYGTFILRSVALGWAIAGTIAVLLAALMGWFVSRRLTQPLLALTAVTTQMSKGNLTARANVHRADELGVLGHSFNQMADQLENRVTTLRQFAADAAHELHTPLTALQTDLQLLTDVADGEHRQRVERAKSQAIRLQTLADSLLDLSRLEAEFVGGKRPLINLTQLLQTIGELVASQAEQAGLEFEMTLPETAVHVHGDEARLRQAANNLLENSLKFTPPTGKIELSLTVEGSDAASATAVVTVQDNGIGIPEEDLPKLFSRFHRGVNSAKYAGNGLGLAIVKAIVTNHHGQVSIENMNQATRAQIKLPSVVE